MLKLKQVTVIENFNRNKSYGHLGLFRQVKGKPKYGLNQRERVIKK